MNNILRINMMPLLRSIRGCSGLLQKHVVRTSISRSNYSRSLWHMSSSTSRNGDFMKAKPLSECCRCGCSGLLHTGGERDLVEFLEKEIVEEKKSLKLKSLPAELDGFAITADQAELKFTKKNGPETVEVSMNINQSVDMVETGEDGDYLEEMKAKPNFTVDIIRNQKTLGFNCAFLHFDETSDKNGADLYEITQITYWEGELDDKSYSVSADLLDENLYDLFMVVLREKGITMKFVDKISEIATSHEHSQYIGLLENVRKFASVS